MANDPNDDGPVWSTLEWDISPCAACPDYATFSPDNVLQYSHCGGTGGICIDKATGHTCSVGSAPSIGNFPGGIKDFIWWGNGAYGLSSDGTQVYHLGTAHPVDPAALAGPFDGPPWDNLFIIGPDTIAVSGVVGRRYKEVRIKTNSVANHTCCG